jgi:Transposase and inactivated derivatives
VTLLCVPWYLRYSLNYRDLEEMMAESGLSMDHVTIWRWVQRYAPILNQRIRRELRRPNRSWRVDETYVKVAGNWAYLYRAVDSTGASIEFMLSPNRDLIAACRQKFRAAFGFNSLNVKISRIIEFRGHL